MRLYYGHTQDVYGGGFPTFEQYDLGIANTTSYAAFNLRAGTPKEDVGQIADSVIFETDDLGQFANNLVQITGPTGIGDQNMVPRGVPLPYTIAATHNQDASLPVREIRIIVPMDDTLDERSFQLSDIDLGGTKIPIPSGRPSFVGEFDLTTSEGFVLQVTAGVDAISRNATWLLRAIDARDGLPPQDPTVGLLKPGEQIRVGFWVEAETVAAFGTGGDVETGDLIELTAESSWTNKHRLIRNHTLPPRRSGPTSTWSVIALGGDRYQLSWSAIDDAQGSGVEFYSLLVSTDGGNRYRTVLYQTTTTEYLYRAGVGETPLFLVRAIDKSGNIEAAPAGVRVPRLTAPINLGSPPVARLNVISDLPTATPTTSTASDRIFQESSLGVVSRSSTSLPSRFPRVIRPLAAERFATIPGISGASIGSLAMATSPDEQWLYVSGGEGRNRLYRMPLNASTRQPELLATLTSPIYELVFDEAGQLWATTGGAGLLQLDPTTGTPIDSIGAGIALGIVSIPNETALYIATTGGVLKFNTATRSLQPFSNVRVDSLAIDRDGTLYGTQWPKGGQILRFDFRGRATRVSEIRDAESIEFGAPGTLLEGTLIVGHQNSGQLTLLDPKALRQQVIASGGAGRVEGIESLSDGRFLVTQGDQVDLFYLVAAPRVIETRILEGNNLASLAFDVALKANSTTDSASATNPSNYRLVNLDTNETVSVGAIRYDSATRTTNMLFETLPPAPYRLTVSPLVESEQGIPIGGQGESIDFRVFENVTAVMPVQFSNTRINRQDGTVLVDVQVTNQGAFDIAGPIQILFGQLSGANVSVLVNGVPADTPRIELYSDGRILKTGQSTTAFSVVVSNPNLFDLDFAPTVRAALPPNRLPEFLSQPSATASLGQAYSYSANAQDPDGSTITYVLSSAPDGASIDATTGSIQWSPDRWTEPQVDFELRAYDSRGAYRRQTWKVNVQNANRPPVISPIDDQIIREGELLEIPVSGYDPDGDSIFYFADSLPPGAIFDHFTQTLRWRPSGLDAGAYENVTLIASDGYFETRATFELVVTNSNLPPELSPVNDLNLREGDSATFRLQGRDADGDTLRYRSPNLPPGAFLDPKSGLFEWSPGFDQHGTYDIDFYADDGQAIAQRRARINVANVNGPVAFGQLTPFEFFEGQTIRLRIAATDPEYPGSSNNPLHTNADFFVDQSLFAPSLTYSVTGLPAGAVYDPNTQIFEWTPNFQQANQYAFDFHVTDDGDGTGQPTTDTVRLDLKVLDANGRPRIDLLSNASVAVGSSLEIPIRAVDPDGTPIALEVRIGQSTNLPSWATFVDRGDGTGTLTVQPQPGQRDDYLITVNAKETAGPNPLHGSTQFVLQVTSPNEPPEWTPFFDRVALADKLTQFTIVATDLDQDGLTFTADGLPPGATFVPSSIYGQAEFRWTPTSAQIGTYTISFRVQDSGNGNSANRLDDNRTITLRVRDTNARPTLEPIGFQSVAEGQTLTIQLQSQDSDGDFVSYSAGLIEGSQIKMLPDGVEFDTSTGRLNWTPNFLQAGSYRLRLSASDGASVRSEDVVVQVLETNQAPQFATLPRVFTREGESLFFAINASDPDGQPLVYQLESVGGDWTQSTLPPGLRFDSNAKTLEWQVGFEQAGAYKLNFSATDPLGQTARTTIDVQVFPTNRAPTLQLPSLRNTEIGKPFELQVLAADPDGDNITLVGLDLPAGATLDSSGRLRWTPLGFQAGEHVLRIIASDGELRTQRNLTLVASFEPASPELRLVVTPSFPAVPGQKILIQPIADSDVGLGRPTIKVNGIVQSIDELGRATFVATQPGRYLVETTVTDEEGRSTTIEEPLFVRDPSDREAPTVSIHEITPPIVTEPRLLSVDIGDATLAEYFLDLVPKDGGAAIRIGSGNTSVCHQTTLDPANFQNGFYILRVTARDLGGLETISTAELEINSIQKSSALLRAESDMLVVLDGIEVPFQRIYNSLTVRSLDTRNANTVDVQGVSFGQSWSIPMVSPEVAIGSSSSQESIIGVEPLHEGDRLYLTLPNGQRVGFTFSPQRVLDSDIEVYQPRWISDAGNTWTLQSFEAQLQKVGSEQSYYMVGKGLPYNLSLDPGSRHPVSTLMLSSPDGQMYGYRFVGSGVGNSSRFVLERITSADGQRSLRWTDSGLVADDGRRLTVIRDRVGRITEMVGPNGEQVVYRYDDQGRLWTTIDGQNNQRTFYRYDTNGRLILASPSNAEGAMFTYDNENGQWTGTSPVHANLGGTKAFLAAPRVDSLSPDGRKTFSLSFSDAEVRSSATATITIGVEITSMEFDPSAAKMNGVSPSYTRLLPGKSVALFTLSKAGTYSLEVSRVDGALLSAGFQAEIYLVGDATKDNTIDSADQTLLESALGSSIGSPNYVAAADFDRNGTIDAQDRQPFWLLSVCASIELRLTRPRPSNSFLELARLSSFLRMRSISMAMIFGNESPPRLPMCSGWAAALPW